MVLEIYFLYFNVIDLIIDVYYITFYKILWIYNPFVGFYILVYNIFILVLDQIQNLFLLKLLSFNILNIALKFILLIALLIFVRGGIPRYRYDFLTKVGWIKFLSLILSIFLSSFLLILLF